MGKTPYLSLHGNLPLFTVPFLLISHNRIPPTPRRPPAPNIYLPSLTGDSIGPFQGVLLSFLVSPMYTQGIQVTKLLFSFLLGLHSRNVTYDILLVMIVLIWESSSFDFHFDQYGCLSFSSVVQFVCI